MLLLYISVSLLFIYHVQSAMIATATLYQDSSKISSGTVTFVQTNDDTSVNITGTLTGLNASSAHGFHVHTYPVSEIFPNCTGAGAHFNPYNTSHGPPTANITNRHVGDLGNITTDASGAVVINMEDSIIQLYNITQCIINRTIVVHLYRDDGGVGGFADSSTTGNAGAQVLCGLIKSLDSGNSTTTISATLLNNSTTMAIGSNGTSSTSMVSNSSSSTSMVSNSTSLTSMVSNSSSSTSMVSNNTSSTSMVSNSTASTSTVSNSTSSTVRLNSRYTISVSFIMVILGYIFFD